MPTYGTNYRYLMSRLSLQVFYLWRHVFSTAPLFILWWSNLQILFGPPPPQLSLHRRSALSGNSNGTRSVYSRENPKSSLYCKMSIVLTCAWVNQDSALALPPLAAGLFLGFFNLTDLKKTTQSRHKLLNNLFYICGNALQLWCTWHLKKEKVAIRYRTNTYWKVRK
jgi:hypothetical protein